MSSAAPATADLDPAAAMDQLAESRSPLLIGVRHHSPAVAAAIPALLSSVQPELLMVELPEEMQEWMPWLAHAELQGARQLHGVEHLEQRRVVRRRQNLTGPRRDGAQAAPSRPVSVPLLRQHPRPQSPPA